MTLPKKTSRALVIAAVMASMSMVALEATIVSTAMPQIVAQLGGLNLYSWVFSAFLLTQTAMTVVFGKLADVYGRRPMILVGIAIFVGGSILAGFAWSMPSMIVFRLIQGIGAGAIMPVAMTIVADLYPPRERGKIQGYLASVWATSAVLGPIAGGLIIHALSWSWIFWINVPIGIIAAAGYIIYLHEDVKRERRTLDVLGATLFTVAIASLMIALTKSDTAGDAHIYVAGAVFVVSMILFFFQEARHIDPMISFELWKRRPIAAANAAAVLTGAALMGLTTFLPVYVQGVLHRSPVVAGLTLTMIMLGWPSGATFTARSFQRFGLRPLMIVGSILIPAGASLFTILSPASSPLMAGFGSLVMGFGMGLVSVSSLLLIQEITDWSQRGSATASNLFGRNLGSTLGAAILGAVFNYGLGHSAGVGAITSEQLRRVIESTPDSTDATSIAIRTGLQSSLHTTFWAMFAMTCLMIMMAVLVPTITLSGAAKPSELPAE
ncbi:MAG TPA: MDR family MFS transporter [Magnetospirillaceae bacterium]|jgi:EmrB/QacA subfamily drug resistance transporter